MHQQVITPLRRMAVLLVRVRRFRCGNLSCPRQTFAEPLGTAAARSARRTARLGSVQRQLGLAPGGEAGTLSAWLRRHGGIEIIARITLGAKL